MAVIIHTRQLIPANTEILKKHSTFCWITSLVFEHLLGIILLLINRIDGIQSKQYYTMELIIK
jgi:hypothetical protein